MSEEGTGRCLCGKVQYAFASKPLYNTVCYCLNCRRCSGTAFYTASIIPIDGFKVTQGLDHQKIFLDKATDSGTDLKRVFCSDCGTNLFAFTDLWKEIVSVAAGTMDDFESWKPDTEQYCMHRPDWLEKVKAVAEERTFKAAVRGSVDPDAVQNRL